MLNYQEYSLQKPGRNVNVFIVAVFAILFSITVAAALNF